MYIQRKTAKKFNFEMCLFYDIYGIALEGQTAETVYRIRDNTPNQWAEVVKLYKQNKELRK